MLFEKFRTALKMSQFELFDIIFSKEIKFESIMILFSKSMFPTKIMHEFSILPYTSREESNKI